MLAEGCQLVVLGSGDAHLEDELPRGGARASRPRSPCGSGMTATWRAASTRAPTRSSCRRATSRAASASSSRCATAPCRSCAARAGSPTPSTEFDPARRTRGPASSSTRSRWTRSLDAVRRAAAAYRQPALWKALVKNAMAEDFSWEASAREYATLYGKALKARSAAVTGGPDEEDRGGDQAVQARRRQGSAERAGRGRDDGDRGAAASAARRATPSCTAARSTRSTSCPR